MFQRNESASSVNSSSTEIAPEIKAYLDQYKIESLLTKAINEVMVKLPIDPFSEICSILKTESKDIFSINSIIIKNIIIEEFKTIPAFEISMTYKGATRTVLKYPIPFSSVANEKFTSNQEELTNIFNDVYHEAIRGFNYETPNQLDENLLQLMKNKEKENDPMALSLCNTISLMGLISTAFMKNISLPQYIKEYKKELLFDSIKNKTNKIPNLGFCIFKTGKNVNSKIKYERFLLMINSPDGKQIKSQILIDLYNKLYEAIKKVLTAGKAGEAGMKTNNEGSFTPPSDKYEDVLKLMEGFAKDVNTAMDNQNYVSLGIDINADNFYNPKDNTYDTEGAKKPLDSAQLVDTYIKLIADHPSITYLEEPIAADDQEGWSLMMEKFQDKPNIYIVKKVDLYKKIPENPNPVGEQNDPNKANNEANAEKSAKEKENAEKEKEKAESKKAKEKSANKKKKKTNAAKQEEQQQVKTEETVKKEPPKINLFSYRLGEANVITHLFDNILKLKESNKEVGGIIYESDIEANQAGIIYLGLSLNVDYIILNGLNMSEQKITKIKSYLEEISIPNEENSSNVEENNVVVENKEENNINNTENNEKEKETNNNIEQEEKK